MTDRELLKLAAKAAAYEIDFDGSVNGWYVNGYDENGDPAAWWNPLTDDGDALRLAVKLQIEITTYPKAGEVGAGRSANLVGYGKHGRVFEYFRDDPYAATRRAIVRAAAEIGKELGG